MKLRNIKRLITAVGLLVLVISLLTGPQEALRCSVPVTGMITKCESGEEYNDRDGSWTTKYHIAVQYLIDGETHQYSAGNERTAKIPGSDYLLFVNPDAPECAVSAAARISAIAPPAAGAVIFAAGIILLITDRRRA